MWLGIIVVPRLIASLSPTHHTYPNGWTQWLISYLLVLCVGVILLPIFKKKAVSVEQQERDQREQRRAAGAECLGKLQEISDELPEGKRLDLE